MELRKINQKELNEILKLHKLWLESNGDAGKRAVLNNTDLSHLDLSDTDLSYAILKNVDLSNTDLSNTDFSNADLSDANLYNANLSFANLRNTDLSNTILYKTDLLYAKINNMVGFCNVGVHHRTAYYFYKADRVIFGCFDDTLEEFKKAVKRTYGEDYGDYKECIQIFESYKEES